MKCSVCDKEINDNARFCKYCGSKMEGMNSEKTNSVLQEGLAFIICQNCGKSINSTKSFCTNCGTSLKLNNEKADGHNVVVSKKEVKRKSQKKGLLIATIVFIIVVAGAFGAIIHFNSLDNIKSNNNSVKRSERETERADIEEETGTSVEIEKKQNLKSEVDAEVESEVNKIIDIYNTTVSSIENGNYKRDIIEEGVEVYSDNNKLKAIVVSKDYSKINYTCNYYFDDDKLIFAYYEGENAHRFYFKNEKMIRWKQCDDISKTDDGITRDMEDTAEYSQWESTVKQNAKRLKRAFDSVEMLGRDDYIIPDSNSRIITEADLDKLTKEEIKLARNEIYARYGRKFKDDSLNEYFEQFDWYHPETDPDDFDESILNEYEVANRDFIVQYEKDKGYR